MLFLDRKDELRALSSLPADGGLAVVWGRRRIGKTRLLLEWCERSSGVYTVADQSVPETQRDYFARAVASALPGFGDVTYPDWERLLSRLVVDAVAHEFRGPIVIDEFPYLVAASPELPSVLQRWIDHDVRRAGLTVALAGSSQRMMQGLVLSHDAPLYGRAHALLDLAPLPPRYLTRALGGMPPVTLLEHWTAWGGVPRYWELAANRRGSPRDRILELVLDPTGALFTEPERLLLEESPPAIELRPILDAIGAGAHRLSEIAGRIARAATSLAKPLDRLVGMGLVRRETPHGEPPRGGKRSLYRIDDPFLRLWFRVVAPNRAALLAGTRETRRALLDEHWDHLVATAWEDLCREAIPRRLRGPVARLGPWQPATRYWHGNEPEWDVVASSVDEVRTLLGEAWFTRKAPTISLLHAEARRLLGRQPPPSVRGEPVHVLFIPRIAAGTPRVVDGVHILTLSDVLG